MYFSTSGTLPRCSGAPDDRRTVIQKIITYTYGLRSLEEATISEITKVGLFRYRMESYDGLSRSCGI